MEFYHSPGHVLHPQLAVLCPLARRQNTIEDVLCVAANKHQWWYEGVFDAVQQAFALN